MAKGGPEVTGDAKFSGVGDNWFRQGRFDLLGSPLLLSSPMVPAPLCSLILWHPTTQCRPDEPLPDTITQYPGSSSLLRTLKRHHELPCEHRLNNELVPKQTTHRPRRKNHAKPPITTAGLTHPLHTNGAATPCCANGKTSSTQQPKNIQIVISTTATHSVARCVTTLPTRVPDRLPDQTYDVNLVNSSFAHQLVSRLT